MNLPLGFILGVVLASGNVWAASASQYNMSLQDEVVTGPKGSLTSPQAASVNKKGQIEEKNVRKIADGIYRIANRCLAAPVSAKCLLGDVQRVCHSMATLVTTTTNTLIKTGGFLK